MQQQSFREFTHCPRCHAPLRPAVSYNGTPSEFWLECTKCNTFVNTYIPQAHQEGVHTDTHTFVGNFGGYGTGKTTTSREEFYKHMLITPNGNTLIGAKITPQYEQTIKRDIENDVPVSFVANVSTQKSYMDFINGHRLMYRPLDDEGKLRSLNLSMFIIVEASEVDPDIYAQLKTRLRNQAAALPLKLDGKIQYRKTRNGGQIPIITHSWLRGIIESNPDSGYIRTDILLVSDKITKYGGVEDVYAVQKEQQDPDTATHVAASDVNEYLPPDPATFIRKICKNKPDWWVRRYTRGSFSYAEGLVYPNAMQSIIPTFEVPKDWKRMVAFDYGLSDPARFIFGAIDEQHGILYIYKELSADDNNIEQLSALYFEGIADIPSGGLLMQPIIDPKSGPKRDYNKKSLADYFLDYGISFKPGVVSVDARVFRLNTYIDSGRLKIMECCRLLIAELRDYKYPPRKLGEINHAVKPVDKNNHSINPLEWIVMELPANPANIVYGVYNLSGNDITKARITKEVAPWQLRDDDGSSALSSDDDEPFYGDSAFKYLV